MTRGKRLVTQLAVGIEADLLFTAKQKDDSLIFLSKLAGEKRVANFCKNHFPFFRRNGMLDATLDDGGKGTLSMCSTTGHFRDLIVNEVAMGTGRIRVIKSQNIIIYLAIIPSKIRHDDIKKNRKSKFVAFPK